MKPLLLTIFLAAAVGCGDKKATMRSNKLPEGWIAGNLVPADALDSDPPESSDPARIQFYGYREGDPGHRLYSVPADTPVAEIVAGFEVGSHGAMSYGGDPVETVKLVAEKAATMAEWIPSRVTFADPAGLKLKFLRPVTDADLERISKLFPEHEGFQVGAEAYIIEQEPGNHLFHRVKEENLFHFWWD